MAGPHEIQLPLSRQGAMRVKLPFGVFEAKNKRTLGDWMGLKDKRANRIANGVECVVIAPVSEPFKKYAKTGAIERVIVLGVCVPARLAWRP